MYVCMYVCVCVCVDQRLSDWGTLQQRLELDKLDLLADSKYLVLS